MNKVFKNEKSILGKFEAFCWRMWEKEPIRFLFAGGVNTLLGILLSILFRFLFDQVWHYNPKFVFWTLNGVDVISFDIPYLIAFVIGLPVAYTTHTLLAFRTKWKWKRFLRYPISAIPNFLLQEVCILIFDVWLNLPSSLSYILGAILPLPIMFFIIRVLVKPTKKETEKEKIEEK